MMVKVLAWGLIVILVSGCSSWHATRLAEPGPGVPAVPKLPEKVRVHLVDGRTVGLTHASADGDSLRGLGPKDQRLAFALKDVRAIEVRRLSAGKTVLFVLSTGLYKSTSSLAISSGDLTLDGQGDANAVWIFQVASTLTTTSGRAVVLIGSAKASNVFWQVGSSATLGTTTDFKGTIMADQAITLNTGATLNGRALARIAGVALANNSVVIPTP